MLTKEKDKGRMGDRRSLQEQKENKTGMHAQDEVKPRQGPFVGDGTRMSGGSTLRYNENGKQMRELANGMDHAA